MCRSRELVKSNALLQKGQGRRPERSRTFCWWIMRTLVTYYASIQTQVSILCSLHTVNTVILSNENNSSNSSYDGVEVRTAIP